MAKKKMLDKPTEAELAILRVLWQRGPSTVREVTEVLQPERGTGYTTTLKLLQIMAEKGLVTRDESARSHIYEAAASETATQRTLIRDLLEKAFGGSAKQLVMQVLATRRSSPEDLAEIRRMLDQFEQRGDT